MITAWGSAGIVTLNLQISKLRFRDTGQKLAESDFKCELETTGLWDEML